MTKPKAVSPPPPETPEDDWGTLDDETDYVNVLFYGDGGTGKTTDLASFARLGPVVFIPAEPGLKKGPLQRLGIPLENLKVQKDTSFSALDDLFWKLKGWLEDDPDRITAVCIDSATALHKSWVKERVRVGVQKAERKGIERSMFDTFEEDWGVMSEQMRLTVRQFIDLPCHFGLSALERRDQDHDGKVRYGPAVNPALQTDLFGAVDIVAHTYAEDLRGWDEDDEVFLASFRAVGKFRAKDRFKVLPKKMPNPTADRIVSYVRGELTKQDDPDIKRFIKVRDKAKSEDPDDE